VDYSYFTPAAFDVWYQQLKTFPWPSANPSTEPLQFHSFLLSKGACTLPLLEYLIIRQGLQVQVAHGGGDTLLHLVVPNRQPAIVHWLLTHGANANAVNQAGYTPLHIAASCGDTQILEILLKAGVAIDYQQPKTGHTALDKALSREQNLAAEFLLAHGATKYAASHEARVTNLRSLLAKMPQRAPISFNAPRPLVTTATATLYPMDLPNRSSAAASPATLMTQQGLMATQLPIASRQRSASQGPPAASPLPEAPTTGASFNP
jgi:hypothetical protein